MRPSPSSAAAVPLLIVLAAVALGGRAETPAQLLAGYRAQASSAPSAARGQQFFTTPHEREWSCSTCHGVRPVDPGQHATTGRRIAPLAPAFNAERFTDPARTEKWFRRNCNDVVGRECTPAEKADVMSWLLSLKP